MVNSPRTVTLPMVVPLSGLVLSLLTVVRSTFSLPPDHACQYVSRAAEQAVRLLGRLRSMPTIPANMAASVKARKQTRTDVEGSRRGTTCAACKRKAEVAWL